MAELYEVEKELHDVITDESSFTSKAGLKLHSRAWLPANSKSPRAVIVVVHGLAEHGGRYDDLARRYASRGFAVYSHDHAGHGLSEGARISHRTVCHYFCDLEQQLQRVRDVHPDLPLFVMGHSMGAMISVTVVHRSPQFNAKVVLISPLVHFTPEILSPGKVKLLRMLSRVTPGSLPVLRQDPTKISRDVEMIANFTNDPLCHRGAISLGFLIKLEKEISHIDSAVGEMKFPLLVTQGTADTSTPLEATQWFFDRYGGEDKTMILYEDALHSLHNELPATREKFHKDVFTWISEQLAANT